MNKHADILAEYELKAERLGACPIPVISNESITLLCGRMGPEFKERFNELANRQTCSTEGMYHYDVADILRTMQTGIDKKDWD